MIGMLSRREARISVYKHDLSMEARRLSYCTRIAEHISGLHPMRGVCPSIDPRLYHCS